MGKFTTAFTFDQQWLANEMSREGFLSDGDYHDIMQQKTLINEIDKARTLYFSLKKKITLSNSNLEVFLGILLKSKNSKTYKEIIEIIRKCKFHSNDKLTISLN